MFCPEDGTKVEPINIPSIYKTSIVVYNTCPKCGTKWLYDGEEGTYSVARYEGEDDQARLAPTMEENYEGCSYCGQRNHTTGSCLEPADFGEGEPC
ncbi:hypothetical protein LCGC14_2429440 [marine sediment metagenome]|uniref:Transcription factor zinc-finger domain-containing protein n=1 Tax=marine sediment metagenome TaxID=412755 RepID=A0A0F9DZC9_9ZZZZ